MLNTQYRMHPGISAFPRKEFYNSTLQDSNDDPTGITEAPLISSYFRECKARSKDKSLSTIFIHHDHGESRSSQSRTNHGDMSIVVSVVEDLLRRNPDMLGKDIGVIAPYSAQIRHLSRILKDNQEWKAYFLEHLGKKRASEIQNIDIQTVDGFQGREKKAIIFSTVRNNRFGYIGFLADRRRMNVALTRAKSGLFVIGNMATLSKHVYSPNLDIETIEDQKGEERVYRKGVEWRNYVRDVVARGLFIEYYHPVKYVSGTANR